MLCTYYFVYRIQITVVMKPFCMINVMKNEYYLLRIYYTPVYLVWNIVNYLDKKYCHVIFFEKYTNGE